MPCPTCSTENPEVALYCYRCGTPLRGSASTRDGAYAVQSSEGVNQFALVSTILPHTNRETADNYRWAMIISAALIVAATGFGLLPIAVAAAAFMIPIVYLVYIYDVNMWEDAPVPVVAGLFLGTGVLAVLVTLFFFRWVFDEQFNEFAAGARIGISGLSFPALLLFAVVLPIVAEVVKNIGGVWLASRPQYDDMIDGLTFGIAAGTAYAAFETIVLYSSVFTSAGLPDHRRARVVGRGDRQPDGGEVAHLRHRHRHRGRGLLGQGRGLRRVHQLLLHELRPRRRRPTSATGSGSDCCPTCRSARRSGCCGAS